MPKRTNLFQQVIAAVFSQLGDGDKRCEESGELYDPVAEKDREVDVVIRGSVAGQDIIVCVEATARKRPATIEWVENMLMKHQDLPTNRLVLVAEAGFAADARTKAEKDPRTVACEPTDIADPSFVGRLVGRLDTIWRKEFTLKLTETFVIFDTPELLLLRAPPPEGLFVDLVDGRGRHVGSLGGIFEEWASDGARAGSAVKIDQITEDREETWGAALTTPWTLARRRRKKLFVQFDDGDRLPIRMIDMRGPAEIRVNEVALQHKQLNTDTAYTYGQTTVDGKPVLLVGTISKGKEALREHPVKKTSLIAAQTGTTICLDRARRRRSVR